MSEKFKDLTEAPGQLGSREQIHRMFMRYHFARQFCREKDVLELGCGAGQGLGYLAREASLVVGGDYTESLLRCARNTYQGRMPLCRLDAQFLPFRCGAFDVVILYEAIYYLPHPEEFVAEAARVLRPEGRLLICQPNKSLPDFHESPFSYRYFTPEEQKGLLEPHGFKVSCYGDTPVDFSSPKAKLAALVKRGLIRSGLMPRTLKGRQRLKRLAFGRLVPVPAELEEGACAYVEPDPIEAGGPCLTHRVLITVGTLPGPPM